MCKVLIVDNEVDITDVLSIILSANGFEVCTRSTGDEFQDHVREFAPDIILLDVNLDHYDGRQFCMDIKSEELTKHIRVILFSASHEIEESAIKSRADGFIEKPFDIDELVQMLKQHCN
jgi:DNA-binding response OmpR family regulator